MDDAQEALRVADEAPRRAVTLADAAVARAREDGDLRAWSVALRARGLATIHRGDLGSAAADLREAVRVGVRSKDHAVEGAARMTLAAAHGQHGRFVEALREIEHALAILDGPDADTALAARGMVLLNLGRLDEAIADLDRALPTVRRAGDRVSELKILLNRGATQLMRFEVAAAEADLRAAVALGTELDLAMLTGFARANLAYALVLRGDVPAALTELGEAEPPLREHASQLGPLLSMRGELLLSVRLLREGREVAEQSLAVYQRDRRRASIPDAHLLIAQIAAAAGDHAAARRHARRAVRGYAQQQRPELTALSRLVLARAQDADPFTPPVAYARVAEVAAQVAAAGWPAATVEAHLLAGRAAARQGRTDEAQRLLAAAATFRSRSVPATVRARAWYAEALRRHGAGDSRGARRAARDGLLLLDDNATVLGATDLRAHAAGHRTELAGLGLTLSLADGDARATLVWADRGRATQLLGPRVRPPSDPELASDLQALRAAVGDVEEQRAAGGSAARAMQRQVGLELRIRDRVRVLSSRAAPSAGLPTELDVSGSTPSDWASVLGDRALVEYVLTDGRMVAVTLAGGRARLHDLGPATAITDLLHRLPFALHRLGRATVRPDSARAALALLRDAAARLEAMLLPMRQVRDRELVVVPTGPLQGMPWSILPALRGRPITVSPSAALWQAAMTAPAPAGDVVVAAGPGLVGAPEEAVRVAAIHGVRPLVPPESTVAAVARGLDGAGLAHLATHGRLSVENPLFSQLLLADGPLVAYDLEHLDRYPHTVVLAACESGRNAVRAGDELLGFTATLLAGGSAQLAACVVPVPDAQTVPVMLALHTGLAAGHTLARALADAQCAVADDDPAAAAAAAGFVCLGAGFLPVPSPKIIDNTSRTVAALTPS
jgi:tetratricopeptide (TPR) repeat protein